MTTQTQPPLRFTGHEHLIPRLILSTLTGRAIRVSQIRPSSPTSPGLLPYEVSFLRLLESLTNGTSIEFSYTGTALLYRPGLITGSLDGYGARDGLTTHTPPADCTRGASYFLLPVCLLAPFAKAPLNVLLTGPGVITSATAAGDISADALRTAVLPLFAHFGLSRGVELRVLRRSGPGPRGVGGAGEVQLRFGHQVRLPSTLHLLAPGRVKRIRGVAYAVGVSGANNARMIEAARGVLNPLCGDTYVYSDVSAAPSLPLPGGEKKKAKVGVGFGLSLVAETTTGVRYSADEAAPTEGGVPAEEVGRRCAWRLLEAVEGGGCVDRVGAPVVLVLMAMGAEDVGRVCLGKDVLGTEEVVGLARDLRAFGLGAWGLREAEGGGEEVVVTVVGKGIGNVGRKIA